MRENDLRISFQQEEKSWAQKAESEFCQRINLPRTGESIFLDAFYEAQKEYNNQPSGK